MPALPKGSTFAIATDFGPAVAINSIGNGADPTAIAAVVHGLVDGDIVEATSGWTRMNRRIFKVDQLDTTTFKFLGLNTSNTGLYPPGSSLGSIRKINGWTAIPKVMNPQTTGGDPKNVSYEFLEDENEYQINNGFAAIGYSIEIDDDITTLGFAALTLATDEQTDTVMRLLMKGAKNPTYLPCNVAMNPMPVLNEGSINRLKVGFNGRARPTRYNGANTGG